MKAYGKKRREYITKLVRRHHSGGAGCICCSGPLAARKRDTNRARARREGKAATQDME